MNKTTEPIRSMKKVDAIFAYLKGKSHRDYVMAKVQFNTALRISDVLKLKVCDVMLDTGKIRNYIEIKEQKTGKSKKIALNKPVSACLKDYINENSLDYNNYLFLSRKGRQNNRPISDTQAHRIMQDVAEALNLENFGTHSLRKTWGYFCYQKTKNIALIMDVFNHASMKDTLRYIGITQDHKDDMYYNINF